MHTTDYSLEKTEELYTLLDSHDTGLTEAEVTSHQIKYGVNVIHKKNSNLITVLVRQFTSNPLILLLVVATSASYVLGQVISSYYIFGMILLSVVLGFWNEFSAEHTVDLLLKKIALTAIVVRHGLKDDLLVSHITVGDVIMLSQGNIIPADLRLLEAHDLEINESALTGEAKTVHKTSDVLIKQPTAIGEMKNIAFMGTTVVSGSAKGIVIRVGRETEFGKIAKATSYLKPTTQFQKGLTNYGQLIIKVILVLTVSIFVINALLGHHWLESLLFALAIAVGLTPELLPVIVTVSLSHGAGKLAKRHVIAKQLISIENLGNMDILCTDKTGTLTEGKITVVDVVELRKHVSIDLFHLSLFCNSAIVHHKVIGNAIDVALWEHALFKGISLDKTVVKINEEPFDYHRKLSYAVLRHPPGETLLVVKGAPDAVLKVCKQSPETKKFKEKVAGLNRDGYRVILIAEKKVAEKKNYDWDDVVGLDLIGYITFLDVPKHSAKVAIGKLESLHVTTKIITGDNELVTQKVCSEIGIVVTGILLGPEIEKMSDAELQEKLLTANICARMNPELKLRVIQTLQKAGHTVGFLGDGINDIPSLHAADVGISVNTAVDVAKDAASVVLLRKSLQVIADGIMEGRRTFSNTIKYILMGTSSNFGNMFSAAGASFFLPFLPMTPVQILLTNGIYDVSQLAIPSDNVDEESLLKPRHWDISFIKKYMVFFGPLSSIYDFLTFGIMLFFFHARGSLFQTGWFMESIATEILVVFVIRTARTPFFRSFPSKWLLVTCLSLTAIGIALPFSPLAHALGFTTPPPAFFAFFVVLVTTYLLLVETVKNFFLRKYIM